MHSSHKKFYWQGSHTTIDGKDGGDYGSGGGNCNGCGCGREARPGLLDLLFNGHGGELVDLLLGLPYGGDPSDRTTTLPLPLSTMGV